MTSNKLSNMPFDQTFSAAKKATVTYLFEFAKASGVMETAEGPVDYVEGDALLTRLDGRRWAIERSKFDSTYKIVADDACAPIPVARKAIRRSQPFRARPSWANEDHFGAPGDVELEYEAATAHKPADRGVVTAAEFERTYDIIG